MRYKFTYVMGGSHFVIALISPPFNIPFGDLLSLHLLTSNPLFLSS